MKYRKKPVEIEARQLFGTAVDTMGVCEWLVENGYPWIDGDWNQMSEKGPDILKNLRPAHGPLPVEPDSIIAETQKITKGIYINPGTGELVIRTLEGDMTASYGDYIIKGVKGEFYPCKPDIFNETYELVEENVG